MKGRLRTSIVLLAAFVLSACALFDGDDEDLKPTELTKIDTKIRVKRLWSVNVGADAEFLRVALRPIGDGSRIYAASRDGKVVGLDPETGRENWRRQLDTELSAGPGVGDGLVVVASAGGYLIALDASTGEERWRRNVGGESLATPVVKDNVVVILTIDNRLRGLSAFDGSERWIVEQSIPRLTMRGSPSPVAVGSTIIAGFDNGRLMAVDLASGDIEWDTMLSTPSGKSDLERLADIDGMISVVGQDVYAAGYQGSVASIAAESGQILWNRNVSSFEGVSADWNNLYTVDDEGGVIALTRRTGDESWRQNSLLRREPTLPIPFQTTVVVGDLEGYLHFFSNFDGDPVARVKTGGQAVSIEPIVVADRLYVQSDSGTVSAYVVEQPNNRSAPDIADEGA